MHWHSAHACARKRSHNPLDSAKHMQSLSLSLEQIQSAQHTHEWTDPCDRFGRRCSSMQKNIYKCEHRRRNVMCDCEAAIANNNDAESIECVFNADRESSYKAYIPTKYSSSCTGFFYVRTSLKLMHGERPANICHNNKIWRYLFLESRAHRMYAPMQWLEPSTRPTISKFERTRPHCVFLHLFFLLTFTNTHGHRMDLEYIYIFYVSCRYHMILIGE